MSLEVIKPGSQSSIQGFGVWGRGSQGMAPGGVMDRLSARVANLIVSNPPEASVLEFTLLGPELLILNHHTVSVFGGDFKILLNGQPQAWGEAFSVKKGDRLKIGSASQGVRGYLAIAGGFKPTHALGALQSSLQSGDRLDVLKMKAPQKTSRFGDAARIQKLIQDDLQNPIRVLPGPQAHFFSKTELHKLVTESYRVSPHSNRMGIRLEGTALKHQGATEIPSEANTFGAIQVPPSGLPIVLGADLPITGGYPKIATVIERDHWRLAQVRPGDELRLEWCTLEDARRLRLELVK
ncbi:MAG: biotin-dependent carboxyltransferase family protein [Bdellovibrionales bacterium]|nr:biotin-dependent carboxyltransferase family protein [Bdellovibrionales bacterium]